jgi:hypothetical protein
VKRDHDELLWALSDGSKSDMDAWDREDVDRVFTGLEIHQARVKRALKEAEQHAPKRRANAHH